jgi:hypothetical protein
MDSRLRGNDGKYKELDSGLRRNDEQKRRAKQTIPPNPPLEGEGCKACLGIGGNASAQRRNA